MPLAHCSSGAVAIAGSAGGISALMQLLSGLPANFTLPIFVAQHLARQGTSILPKLLNHRGMLRAKWAEQNEIPQAGLIYLVPPAHDLTVTSRGMRLSKLSPPAAAWLSVADTLLHSVANVYRDGAIGVVLSGMIPVGLRGLRAIRHAGGLSFAQSVESSAHSKMPEAAIDFGKADLIFSPARIAEALEIVGKQRANPTAPHEMADQGAGRAFAVSEYIP